jgi:hypothetical protein
MPDDQRPSAGRELWRHALERVADDGLVERETIGVAESEDAPRASSIVESRRASRPPITPRDVQQLSGLTQADWAAAREEWRRWYRRYHNSGPAGVLYWCLSVLVAWLCLGYPGAVASVVNSVLPSLHSVPPWTYTLVGWIALIGVAGFLQAAFGTLFGAAFWDAFSAGYSNGVRLGIDRALKIPDAEKREVPTDGKRTSQQ